MQAIVSGAPGETITHLVLALAADRGETCLPRAGATGTHLPLPARLLRGSGEIVVTVRDGATTVSVLGSPPPWPLSIGWEARTLRRLLGRRVLRLEEE